MEAASLLPQSPGRDLESYMHAVSARSVLTAEEEVALAERFREQGDVEAARSLVLAHLRFVVHIAKGYSGYGLPLSDLVQEGNIGLMKAVKRFDPGVGVRLVSFAVHWIRAEIHEFILRNWRIVKVASTKAQRKLFYKLRSAKKRLGWFNPKEVEAVAKDLGVEPKVVLEMERRMAAQDVSFDNTADEDDQDTVAPAQYLEAENADPADLVAESDLRASHEAGLECAISALDERSRDIIQSRWLLEDKLTLHDLADKYDISAERVRQLEQIALKKMRGIMEVA